MIKSFRKTDIAYSLTTLNNPCISESCIEVKSKFLFSHFFVVPQKTSKGLHKTF